MTKFRSRLSGHRARVSVYTCQACLTQFERERPARCICGNEQLLYFPSRLEARRYPELRQLEAQGVIADLVVHPKFRIQHNGIHICNVVADFSYHSDGKFIVEDVKPRGAPLTRSFRLGRKLVHAFHDRIITVLER